MGRLQLTTKRVTRDDIERTAIGIARTYNTYVVMREGDTANYLGYQIPAIRKAIRAGNAAWKWTRQTGKTWGAAFIAVAYILHGIDGLIAYPTLQQGWKLLLSKIVTILDILGVGTVRANSGGIELADGTCIHVVTTSDIAKSNRGFTVGFIMIDEAQDVEAAALGKLMPSSNKYRRRGLDLCLAMGTGGFRTKLLETCWRERGFALTHLQPCHILKVDPGYIVVEEDSKLTLSPEEYRIECLCEVIDGGNSRILKNMDVPLPQHLLHPMTPCHDVVGIDVGCNPDNTVLTQVRVYAGVKRRLEVVRTLQLGGRYDLQLPVIKAWIYEHKLQRSRIRVETNGVGLPIFHFLSAKDVSQTDPIMYVSPFHSSKKIKRGMIRRLQTYDYDHRLHITDAKMYNAMEGICEWTTDDGVWDMDHTDYGASLIAAALSI